MPYLLLIFALLAFPFSNVAGHPREAKLAILLLTFAILAFLLRRSVQLVDAEAAIKSGNYHKALSILEPLAKQGDADAQYQLAAMYTNGEGVRQDYTEAGKWFRKAAEQGHAEAQFNLGVMHKKGDGLPNKSPLAAADWFFKAGDSFLKRGEKDKALGCVDLIKGVSPEHPLVVKLLAKIYGTEESKSKPR